MTRPVRATAVLRWMSVAALVSLALVVAGGPSAVAGTRSLTASASDPRAGAAVGALDTPARVRPATVALEPAQDSEPVPKRRIVRGTTDLDRLALRYRVTYNIQERNIAVYEYTMDGRTHTVTVASVSTFRNSPKHTVFEFRDRNGERVQVRDANGRLMSGRQTSVGGTPVKGKHSEELAEMMLDHLGVPQDAVERTHSERDYCALRGHYCDARTQRKFPDATRTYCYEFTTPEQIEAARRALVRDTVEFRKVFRSTNLLFQRARQPGSTGHLADVLGSITGKTPGGIDFTSLELRYLAENSGEVQYAFRAPQRTHGTVIDGLTNADQASDAFFVWLALSPDKFWVNLNPNEPDRIIDEAFGRTDAGRILLEADLQLKKTVGKLIHPDTKLGEQYWRTIRGDCISSRQWIVPASATVYETGDELYILDAPLRVLMETDYVQDTGTGQFSSCPQASKATEEHNEAAYRKLILPKVEKAVNTAPEYADLRQVYLSRVAAEWYRNRSREVPSAYSDLIDSGTVRQWESDIAWKPVDTFEAYVRSYTKGEFDITRKTRRGDYLETRTYTYGGVDFSDVFYQPLSNAEFSRDWPELSDTVQAGLREAAADSRTNQVWLGGTSIADPASARDQGEPEGPEASRSEPGEVPGSLILLVVVVGVLLMLVGAIVALRKGRRHARAR